MPQNRGALHQFYKLNQIQITHYVDYIQPVKKVVQSHVALVLKEISEIWNNNNNNNPNDVIKVTRQGKPYESALELHYVKCRRQRFQS